MFIVFFLNAINLLLFLLIIEILLLKIVICLIVNHNRVQPMEYFLDYTVGYWIMAEQCEIRS